MTDAAIIARCGEIRTSYEYPPIPVRDRDWAAWFDDRGEDWITGRGRTETAAVEDLLAQAEDRIAMLSDDPAECACDRLHVERDEGIDVGF